MGKPTVFSRDPRQTSFFNMGKPDPQVASSGRQECTKDAPGKPESQVVKKVNHGPKGKNGGIWMPGDSTSFQEVLLPPPSVEVDALTDWPPIYSTVEGFLAVLAAGMEEGYLGLDYEFKSVSAPTIIGIASDAMCAGLWYTPDLNRLVESAAKNGTRLVAHSGIGADKPVFDAAVGYDSPLEWHDDSMIVHFLENSDLTKAPSKDESDDAGSLGFMDLWTATSMVCDVPAWKSCRGSACYGPCKKHSHSVEAYCAMDAWGGLQIFKENRRKLLNRGFNWSRYTERMRLANMLQKRQDLGIRIDIPYRDSLMVAGDEAKMSLFPKDETGKPQPFNPRSAPQVLEYFAKHGIRLASNSKPDVLKSLEKEAARRGFTLDDLEAEEGVVSEELLALNRLAVFKGAGKGIEAWFADKYLDKAGFIHPRFITTGSSMGRLSSAKPNCFSGDTEILTPTGWIPFVEAVKSRPQVAQYHKETGTIDFVQPLGWLEQESSAELVHLESQHIDLLITPDHRCLVKGRRTHSWKTVAAKDYPSDFLQYNAGVYGGGPGEELTFDELRYVIAVQADGWITGKKNWVRFGFTKARKQDRLRELLVRLNWEFEERARPNNANHIEFTVRDLRASDLVTRYYGAGKKFGPWVLQLTRDQLNVFVDELYYWDGLYERRNEYASTIQENVDWVQIAETLSGYRTVTHPRVNNHGVHFFEVLKSRHPYTMTTNVSKTRKPAVRVYCCKVPSDVILVRRNGKVCITHQCQNIPVRGWGAIIKTAVVPFNDEEDIIDADLGQLELRNCLYAAGINVKDIKGDAFMWLVDKADGQFKRAAGIMKGDERDVAKSLGHGSNYLEGIQIYTPSMIGSSTFQKELAVGAIRLYTKKYYPQLPRDWEYAGGVVGFSGVNLAERLFGDRTVKSRAQALSLLEDLYFKNFFELRLWHMRLLEEVESRGYVMLPSTQFLRMVGSPRDNAKNAAAFYGQALGACYAQEGVLRVAEASPDASPIYLQVHDSQVHSIPRGWSNKKACEFIAPMFEESRIMPGFSAPGKVKRGRNYGSPVKLKNGEIQNPDGLKLIWDSSKTPLTEVV
jgi:hypothetical protein